MDIFLHELSKYVNLGEFFVNKSSYKWCKCYTFFYQDLLLYVVLLCQNEDRNHYTFCLHEPIYCVSECTVPGVSLGEPDEGLELPRICGHLSSTGAHLAHLHVVADHLLAGLVAQHWVVLVLGVLDVVPQHLEMYFRHFFIDI